jgi:hypothetical protein
MTIGHWRNDIDRRKQKYSDKNLSQYHLVDYKFHINWPGTEHVPPRYQAGDLSFCDY